MATVTSRSLKTSFKTGSGGKASKTFKHAKASNEINVSNVNTLMDVMIANTAAFKADLVAKNGAQLITNTVEDINLQG